MTAVDCLAGVREQFARIGGENLTAAATHPDDLVYMEPVDAPYTYLGTHEVSWLARPEFSCALYPEPGVVVRQPVPLFVSHRRLAPRRSLPRAHTPWALDSGGFSELSMFGEWRTTPEEYVAAVRRYDTEIGNLEWAAPQDWMCEPHILAKTGLTVAEHQARTVANYVRLMELDDHLPWIPVVQGWTADDYLRCADLYAAAGVDLTAEPLVGVGSVCRRQATAGAVGILRALHSVGITRLHGFGFKVQGLRAAHQLLASSDSMAWSFSARRERPLLGCTHRNCANCPRYALAWRERMLASLPAWDQPALETAA